MAKNWTAQDILEIARSFQPACVITAGATLDVFTLLHDQSMTAEELSHKLGTDLRATTILLDALAALELLTKRDDHYTIPAGVVGLLTEGSLI